MRPFTLPVGRRLRQILTICLVLGALLCMFPPESYTMRLWASHAQHLVLFYLALALLLLIGKQERLMFVSLGCCAAMSYFLNEQTNAQLKNPRPTDMPTLKIAHFNVGSAGLGYREMVECIGSREADLVSCQEISPVWDSVLRAGLRSEYPFCVSLPDLHSTGLAVFSKIPLLGLDTFFYEDTPNLLGAIGLPGSDSLIHFVSSITRPALSGSDFRKLRAHFERISWKTRIFKTPVVAFGEFNVVPWSAEILEFKQASDLLDSRKPMQASAPNGHFNLWEVPVDHIFYSPHFECLKFEELSEKGANHVGIETTLQLKPTFFHAR